MTGAEIVLHGVVAVAALLQGITGIGFALLAGPVILILRDDAASLQIISMLTLAIALMLMPVVHTHVDRRLFFRIALAAIIAMPLGLALYATADVAALKLGAGGLLAALLAVTHLGGAQWVPRGRGTALAAGGVAGITGGALAMIGPPVSLYLTASGRAKNTARATVLAVFVPCYLVLIAGQAVATGFASATLIDAATFLPALALGTVGGHLAAGRVSERLFRQVVTVFLVATTVALILDGSGLLSPGSAT
ncbi:MAG: sulfite exporter TauE/SafE family protein [Pseudomonadota bacterium]